MKRRKAIGRIFIVGTATVAMAGGYEWYSVAKNPDREYLLSKKNLIADLAESIIPATETPGATEAGVIDYLMRFLTECTDSKNLNRFIDGLKDLEKYCLSKFNTEFSRCSSSQKEEVLNYFETKSRQTHSLFEKAKDRVTGIPFFHLMKTYTVYGYCISEKGASIGMNYIAVPGKYLSCISLEPNQKAWATK
jgi:Gluconate 2-dehydrogenase subunit 3